VTVARFSKHKMTWASRQVCQPGAEQANKFVGLVWISVWLEALQTNKQNKKASVFENERKFVLF
jgi:hypothetical protein